MHADRLIPRLRHRADLRTLAVVALALLVLAGSWSGHMRSATFRGKSWNSIFQFNPSLDHRSLATLVIERLRRPAPDHAR